MILFERGNTTDSARVVVSLTTGWVPLLGFGACNLLYILHNDRYASSWWINIILNLVRELLRIPDLFLRVPPT